MNHLDEGTLQAFLDDELDTRERADAAEHLMGCGACRAVHDELRDAKAHFSEAVAELDVEAPARAAPRYRAAWWRGGVGARSMLKAAGLILFLAAAASAAAPGSPVQAWIVSVVRPEPAAQGPAPVAVRPPAPVPPAPPAGLSILPRSGQVDVELSGLDGTTIRLQEGTGEGVSVSARGAERDPVFRSSAGRIGVRDGVGGELLVELPPTLREGRLVVDGRVYAEVVDGELTVRVPGETVDGAVVWR